MSRIKPKHLVGSRREIREQRAIRRLARGLRGGITSPSRPWLPLTPLPVCSWKSYQEPDSWGENDPRLSRNDLFDAIRYALMVTP